MALESNVGPFEELQEGALNTYIVAGTKPWNRRAFDRDLSRLPGTWVYVEGRDELDPELIRRLNPRFIFFLHWSWIVPNEIVSDYECVLFHMTDVPFGRGGSPLQNLIARGLQKTIVSAMRMTDEIDAGPVYLKEPVSLEGSAEDIYVKVTDMSVRMIERIIAECPEPVQQEGEVVMFERRKPADSELKGLRGLRHVYDAIRMVDAEGYPKAYIEVDGLKFEFTRATLYDDRVTADVVITQTGSGG